MVYTAPLFGSNCRAALRTTWIKPSLQQLCRVPPTHPASAGWLPLRAAADDPASDTVIAPPLPAASWHRPIARHRGRQAGNEEVQGLPRLASSTSISPRSGRKKASFILRYRPVQGGGLLTFKGLSGGSARATLGAVADASLKRQRPLARLTTSRTLAAKGGAASASRGSRTASLT